MGKVLYDANIWLEIFLERKKARIAAALVTYAEGDEVDCIFTPVLGHIVYHQVERLKDESLAKQALEDIIEICTIVDTTQVDFYAAFHSKRNDFEDEMMIACALRNQATIIVTNDKDLQLKNGLLNLEIISPERAITRFKL